VARQLRANLGATTLFLQELLLYPQQIGAIVPSSKRLARAMAKWLPADPDAFVLELGPGTGAVTEALFARGLRQDRLVAIEKSARLADLLRAKFPGAGIVTGDARDLDRLVRRYAHGVNSVGAVISSLPLHNFSRVDAEALVWRIRAALAPAGKWVQYSYHIYERFGRGNPELNGHFRLLASDVVWWNLPPARVNVYQKLHSD
jgi:phosphatidylethanolamine/phosphatidyl-N-methylethanolamine N-methyltransferase